MGSFLPVDINIVIGKHGTAYRADANRLLLQTHLFDDFGNELMNYAVRTTRTIVHVIVVQERWFLIYQVLRCYNLIVFHSLTSIWFSMR